MALRTNEAQIRIPGSFRDPDGYVFRHKDEVYRCILPSYSKEYELLAKDIYPELIKDNLLIKHEEVSYPILPDAYKVIKPEQIVFLSYPYEWSFSQLRDAALVTLEILRRSIMHGLILKDAAAQNVQFVEGRAIFIDTLSFAIWQGGTPWSAYGQFCRHFLGPLALMSYLSAEMGKLLRLHLDGIPLKLVSSLLPLRTWLSFPLLTHLHLHALSESRYGKQAKAGLFEAPQNISKNAMLGLIDSLESCITNLELKKSTSDWGNYYQETNYDAQAEQSKIDTVKTFLALAQPKGIWDLGGNIGNYSRLGLSHTKQIVCFDIDPIAVEKNYLISRQKQDSILPLLLDLTNPSPNLGWAESERLSFLSRAPVDTALALALIHHLAIANNIPLAEIAAFFGQLCRYLIIEFVPKQDSQVQTLLRTRRDIFPNYTQEDFERIFSQNFAIIRQTPVTNSSRTVYLLENSSLKSN